MILYPDKNPNKIRKKVKQMDFQNSASITNCPSLSITLTGETINISFPIIKLESVQFINSHVEEGAKLISNYDIVSEEVAKKALPYSIAIAFSSAISADKHSVCSLFHSI